MHIIVKYLTALEEYLGHKRGACVFVLHVIINSLSLSTQEWLTPQGSEWVRENGQSNSFSGTFDLVLMFVVLWFTLKVYILSLIVAQ